MIKTLNNINISYSQEPEKYFQEILAVNEYKKLKTFVQCSNSTMNWEKLAEEGVVRIEGDQIEGIYWKGNLDLRGSLIKTLRKLKKVGGTFLCNDLLALENLGELEEVGGNFKLGGMSQVNTKKPITTLGKLKKVGGYLNCERLNFLENLGNLEEVGEDLELRGTQITTFGSLKKVGKNLICYHVKTLKDTGDLEEVGKDLGIKGTGIKKLKKIKKIGGNLICYSKKNYNDVPDILEDLGILETIGGDIKGPKSKFLWKIQKTYIKGVFYIEEFQKIFGNNINEIEDIEMKRKAIFIINKVYTEKKDEMRKRGDIIIKHYEEKEITKDDKRKIKKEIKLLEKELLETKSKLESFGLKL